MALFKKKPKKEFKMTEPTEEMVSQIDEPIEEEPEEEPEVEQVEEEEEVVEEDEEETDEEKELKQKLKDIEKKKQEAKAKQQPKILIRERAVPVEQMFNNLSDRIEGIELYIAQLDSFLRNKLKLGK